MHVPPELAQQLHVEPEDVEVWPDMQGAVSVFFGMSTQWRWTGAGMAGAFRTGLDYAALSAVAGAVGVSVTPDVLADLRTMEGAAIEQWGRK